MSNLSDKFTHDDLQILSTRLNIATCQVNELVHIVNKLDTDDIYRLLHSFDGISRTAGMLNSICSQLLDNDYISTDNPLSYIHSKSDFSFDVLDKLCVKYSLMKNM